MTCEACESLNYGIICTCGEGYDEPKSKSVDDDFESRGRIRRSMSSRAMEWQGMDGYSEPRE